MTVPQFFRRSRETSITSFDFVDIAAATGIEQFHAGNTVDLNLLSNFIFHSKQTYTTSGAFTDTTSTLQNDVDFDVKFNLPRTIRGLITINVPLGTYTTTSGKTVNSHIIAKVRKWDGTTETEIASNQSTVVAVASTETLYRVYRMVAIDVDIPLTLIKKGESLRLTIEQYGHESSGVNGEVFFGHDPKNRDKGNFDAGMSDATVIDWSSQTQSGKVGIDSQLIFPVPFRIDL